MYTCLNGALVVNISVHFGTLTTGDSGGILKFINIYIYIYIQKKMASSNLMALFSKLEKYNGSEDLSSWLQKFNRCCMIADKNDDVIKGQLIMLCLSGQALAVAEQLEQERQGAQTFAQVRLRLESVFLTTARREQKMTEFESRIQKAGESEDEFMLSLVQLYRSANPDAPDREFTKAVKRKFMAGISPELRKAIFVFVNEPHNVGITYQRLLEFARTAKMNIFEGQSSSETGNCVMNSISAVKPSASSNANDNTEVLNAISNLSNTLNQVLIGSRDNSQESPNAINTIGRGNNYRYTRGNYRGRRNFSNRRGASREFRRPNNTNNQPLICHKCGGENHYARYCLSKN